MRLTDGADGRIRWARDVIERQTAHLKRLVDDLLDVSRVTTGRINLQKETVELKAFVMHAVEAARPSIESRRHRLSVEIERKPVYVLGDSVRLAQAVLNLLNNACRYTPDGGDIRVDATVDGDEAVIRVRDNGQGITADLLPYIFDLFTQADRKLDRSEGGLGIGLTVVRRLVELHDGRVEAHSDGPNRGSEFVIRLPLVTGSESVEDEVRAEREDSQYSSRRILVVDDNEDCAESLGALLSISGYEVKLARDGQSAIEAVRNEIPAVVLLDLGLPDLNGYEIARRLRAMPHGRDILLIAVTGYGQASDRERSKEAGFDYHLVKPVDPFELLDKLGGDKAQA
jgi:CheY-like chemotaxis protein/two-component sensor histidine kinase